MTYRTMAHETPSHVDPEDLEKYAMHRTPELETARIEEHLLLCDTCRDDLDRTTAYTGAMQAAASTWRQQPEPRQSWWNVSWLVPALAGLILLLAGAGVLSKFNRALPPLAVSLVATRGDATGASAPSGRPLSLTPDLTGLPAASSYRLEIVDAEGRRTWQGSFGPEHATLAVPAHRKGLHFVRIYSSSGELLREYGLDIK